MSHLNKHFRKLDAVTWEAHKGEHPALAEDKRWYERGGGPTDDDYWERAARLKANGLRCRIKSHIGGNNSYPDNPMIALQVIPLEQPLMSEPARHNPYWHITCGLHSKDNYAAEHAFFKKYGHWQEVRLRFLDVNDKAHAQLDVNTCPVATDPVIHALHQHPVNHYKDRPLHVSF